MPGLKHVLSGLALMLLACGEDHSTSPSKGEGSISFSISIGSDTPIKKIAKSVELTISAPDMISMVKKLDIKDSTIEGRVEGIPIGKDRLFELKVYDSTGMVRYKGYKTSHIIADSTNIISLPVNRLFGVAIINGKVNEEGFSIDDEDVTALFKFDEGSGSQTEEYKSGITGQLNNSSWTETNLGNAANFNGTNSYITASTSSILNLKDTFSIDIIFRSENTTERRFIFGMRQYQGGLKDVSAEIRDDGKFRAFLHDGAISTHLISLDSVDDGRWHSVSILHKKEISSLYLDGIKQKDSTNADLKISNNTNLLIGHLRLAEFPGRFFFKGDIDLIRFSKIGRSESEIKNISALAGTN